uniref:DNA helicase Pif1-like 2B domain-containing protein n=1 Tax=Phakopsora pachyrhizi TaxID=170000 RepID=A0A0S1MJ77_PHAPC
MDPNMIINAPSLSLATTLLIEHTFPPLSKRYRENRYLMDRAILCAKNTNVQKLNNQIIKYLPTEERCYRSFDSAPEDLHNIYQVEYLNEISLPSFPPHNLILKVGCPIILLRNLDKQNGLCNGSRIVVVKLHPNFIEAEVSSGDHMVKTVYIPRIPLDSFKYQWSPICF